MWPPITGTGWQKPPKIARLRGFTGSPTQPAPLRRSQTLVMTQQCILWLALHREVLDVWLPAKRAKVVPTGNIISAFYRSILLFAWSRDQKKVAELYKLRFICTYTSIIKNTVKRTWIFWVVKSIVKPNTNPTPCTKGMEDSPLDSGQTLISDQTLIGSLYHAHTSRVNNFFMSYMYRQLRWSWYMDKLPNQ